MIICLQAVIGASYILKSLTVLKLVGLINRVRFTDSRIGHQDPLLKVLMIG